MAKRYDNAVELEFPDGTVSPVTLGSLVDSLRRCGVAVDGEPWAHAAQFAKALLDHFLSSVPETRMSLQSFEEIVRFVLRNLKLDRLADHFHYTHTHSIIDLESLVKGDALQIEMAFYQNLRRDIHAALARRPTHLHFRGIKPCIKQLRGAKRYRKRCHSQHEELVEFLHEAVAECSPGNLAIVIS